jgi:plastocyanin
MRRLVIALAIVALIAVGCGKSSKKAGTASPSGGTTTSTTAAAVLAGTVNDHGTTTLSGTALSLTQNDFYFSPTYVKAAAGATVTVNLKNSGTASHTFTIDALSVDQLVTPGQTATVTLRLPAGGTVAWYCKFHKASGMQGAFLLPGASQSGPATTQAPASSGGNGGY